ncbi:MAG: polysaccharide biosynthesis C-terminal domain-containing protein [Deltaproteobacteria bacterium]|nr:polysaccharide biosynthesis C-terminal domain-containing protein [Deltaproteobacteria bacterium]
MFRRLPLRVCFSAAVAGAALLLILGSAAGEDEPVGVAVVPNASAFAKHLIARLQLDQHTRVTTDPAHARVVWLLPDATPQQAATAAAAHARGAGLVVVAGPGVLPAPLLPLHHASSHQEGAVGVEPNRASTMAKRVAFRSMPKLRARRLLKGPGQVVAYVPSEGTVVLQHERVVLIGFAPDEPTNEALFRWGYWNYFVHAATFTAAQAPYETFADWPASPAPHAARKGLWLTFLVIIWPLSLLAFWFARRAGRKQPPDAAREFLRALDRGSPVATTEASSWTRVGFERALGGYFVLVGALVVFIAPYVGIVQFVIPTYVQKFPEVEGMWNSVYEFFWWVWIFFDMGTSLAFVKYFAELRTRDPDGALHAVQFFSWWQILTGALQVTFVSLLGLFIIPHTEYALFSDLIALYGLTQWPGIFFTLAYFFQAAQRYDYYQALDLLQNRFLVVVGPVPFVLMGRAWGANHAEFGEALGAMYGLAVGQNVIGVVVLLVSYGFYRRLGVPAWPLFLANFGKKTVVPILRFGWKAMLAGVLYRIGNAIEVIVLTALLLSYSESIGIKSLLEYNFYFIFRFLAGWADPAIAAFSEAHAAGKQNLVRYYTARYLQWAYLYVAIIFSFMVALAPLFIRRALDPRWAAAAPLVLAACIRGLFLPPALILDSLQKGAGQPGRNAIVLTVEQLCRLGFLFLLVPRYQVSGAFLAMALALAIKCVFVWYMCNRSVVRLSVPWRSVLLAPLLAGALNFCIWRAVAAALAGAGRGAVVTAMIFAAILSFPLCFFFMGMVGGAEPRALAELREGARMASVFAPVARVLAWLTRQGARLRLLAPTFPQALGASAETEARQIEAMHAAAVAAQATATPSAPAT